MYVATIRANGLHDTRTEGLDCYWSVSLLSLSFCSHSSIPRHMFVVFLGKASLWSRKLLWHIHLTISYGVGTHFSIPSWRLPRHAPEDPRWFGWLFSLKLTITRNLESYLNTEVPLKPHGWSGRTSSSQKVWEWMPNRPTMHFHMALSPISFQRKIAALLEILLQIGPARYTFSFATYNDSMTFSLWSPLPGVKNIIACETIGIRKPPAGSCAEH